MMDYVKLYGVLFLLVPSEAVSESQRNPFFSPIHSSGLPRLTPIPVEQQIGSSLGYEEDLDRLLFSPSGKGTSDGSPSRDVTRTIAEKYGLEDLSDSHVEDLRSGHDFDSLLDEAGNSIHGENPSPGGHFVHEHRHPTAALHSRRGSRLSLRNDSGQGRSSSGDGDYYQPSSGYSPGSSHTHHNQPAKKHDQYHKNPKYHYNYHITDDYGNDYGHEETRDGHDVKGSYSVLLPDGRTQTVTYYVSGDSGFVAEVTYDGIPHYEEDHIYRRPKFPPRRRLATRRLGQRRLQRPQVGHHNSLSNQKHRPQSATPPSGGYGGRIGLRRPVKKYRPTRPPKLYRPPSYNVPKPAPSYSPPGHDPNFSKGSQLITPSPYYAPPFSEPSLPPYKVPTSYIPPQHEHSSYA